MTLNDVYQRLREVIDPELNINIVDLGLIYRVSVERRAKGEGYNVKIVMTLTTPGCPLAGSFEAMVKEVVKGLPGIDEKSVRVELTFDPPWTPEMMTEAARIELGMEF